MSYEPVLSLKIDEDKTILSRCWLSLNGGIIHSQLGEKIRNHLRDVSDRFAIVDFEFDRFHDFSPVSRVTYWWFVQFRASEGSLTPPVYFALSLIVPCSWYFLIGFQQESYTQRFSLCLNLRTDRTMLLSLRETGLSRT